MIRLAMRVVLALAGAFFLLIAIRFWMTPETVAAQFALTPVGGLGLATLRADMGGFFAASALFALAAAILDRASLLIAPLLMVALALGGRVLTIAVSGYAPDMLEPMVVEAVLVVLFALGRGVLSRR